VTTPYLKERRAELLKEYRDGLLGDVMPFWLKHGIDREHGGILTSLGRKGELLDSDKSVWFQGRAGWTFGNLYNTVEKKHEWLEASLSCARFLRDKCADTTGKLHFTVTREGHPLRMRRYVFSECFAAIGYGEAFRATGEVEWRDRSLAAYDTFLKFNREPGHIAAKVDPQTRPARGLSPLMMTLVTAQDMRESLGDVTVRGKSLTTGHRLRLMISVRISLSLTLRSSWKWSGLKAKCTTISTDVYLIRVTPLKPPGLFSAKPVTAVINRWRS
jgi:N-acylglucosamine 2-epimerase